MAQFASLCSLMGWYDIPIPTWFLAPIDCLKIPAQEAKDHIISLADGCGVGGVGRCCWLYEKEEDHSKGLFVVIGYLSPPPPR